MNKASTKIFLFPGAGSFGTEFSLLLREFRPNISVIRYPETDEQLDVKEDAIFDKYVESCVQQILTSNRKRVILLGHSFGAYVAYMTALALDQSEVKISQLIVAGANFPTDNDKSFVPPKNNHEVEAYYNSIDCTLLDRLSDEEWRELTFSKTVRELAALSSFYNMSYASVSCSISALCGEVDPLTCDDKVSRWADYTEGDYAFYKFACGHFELPTHPELLTVVKRAEKASHKKLI